MSAGTDNWWIGAIVLGVAVVGAAGSWLSNSTSSNATTAAAEVPPADTAPAAPAQVTSTDETAPAVPAQVTSTAETAPAAQATAETAPAAPAQATSTAEVSPATPAIDTTKTDYLRARWDPIHFKPGIDKATNADCLKCHQEVLNDNVRKASPAGLKKDSTLAWYQTLDTYEGEQMTFHQRHLTAPFINKVANMSCTTCHQGNNPRDETGFTAADSPTNITMRKMVDPNICLRCHGQFPYQEMGLPGPWHQSGAVFQNNCLMCHAAIRTNRHKVNFLKADAIEKEGAANSDTCYGCHGGRAWYRISFPYPRHPWPGMGSVVPDWAKDRPTESDLRFLIEGAAATPAKATEQGSKP